MTHSDTEETFRLEENYAIHRDDQAFYEIAKLDPPFTNGSFLWWVVVMDCFVCLILVWRE
jgi:hypothetical protein